MIYKIKLKVGDLVVVRAGKYKGKTGKVTKTHPKENKVTVDGINIVKKHMKPNQVQPQGSIVEITKPMWVGKVGLVDPETKKASRVGYAVDSEGNRSRIYKSSGKAVKEVKATTKAIKEAK